MGMGQEWRRQFRWQGRGRRMMCLALAVMSMVMALTLLGIPMHRVVRQNTGAFMARPPSLQECLQRIHQPCLTPAQVRAAYGIDTLLRCGITGRGRTIAIVDAFGSPTIRADLHGFDAAFGLPDPQFQVMAPLGAPRLRNPGWASETTLDVEWAHAIAPRARIVLLESPVNETEGVQGLPEFLTLERYALRHHLADVISQSWDATEDTLFDVAGRAIVAQFHAFYAEAIRQGVTIVASSGDTGTTGFNLSLSHLYAYPVVQYPASDPYVLAVGGTHLVVNGQGQSDDELAWVGSGGGASKLFPEPAYQRSLPSVTQRLLRGQRNLPDVAYNAGTPMLMYREGMWNFAVGTSAGAPQWAGLIALADDAAGHDLGLVNLALYRLAASPRYRTVLHDIVRGSINGPTLGHPGGSARPGWDITTGLGSPRAGLVPALIETSVASASSRPATVPAPPGCLAHGDGSSGPPAATTSTEAAKRFNNRQ